MSFDENNLQLWFASGMSSSLKCLDLNKRSLDKINDDVPMGTKKERSDFDIKSVDFELEGLPWITEYHLLKNKRYVITNNTKNEPQVWSIDKFTLIKTY
jgi:hypothetical protein